jgi:hypothetical protein
MKSTVTYEEVETLAEQLPPREQLKLVEKISDRLSKQATQPQTTEEDQRQDHAARVELFLQMSDEKVAECNGKVDSASDIRQIREERASRL